MAGLQNSWPVCTFKHKNLTAVDLLLKTVRVWMDGFFCNISEYAARCDKKININLHLSKTNKQTKNYLCFNATSSWRGTKLNFARHHESNLLSHTLPPDLSLSHSLRFFNKLGCYVRLKKKILKLMLLFCARDNFWMTAKTKIWWKWSAINAESDDITEFNFPY